MTDSEAAPIRLSMVIAAWNGAEALERCLDSLGRWSAVTEIVVAANCAIPDSLAARFSRVRFLSLSAAAVVPELRSAGILASSGEIIALTEDHCRCRPGWSEEIVRAHDDSAPAIGGPVENARIERALDWAVYFYDYGKFMPPVDTGPAHELSGANSSYKRSALMAEVNCFRDGFHEPVVHAALEKHGGLRLDARLTVDHDKTYRLGPAMRQAYHLARSYAARRVQETGLATKWLLTLASPILFLLLPARVIGAILRKRRRIGALARCLPYLLLLTESWAWGEIHGYAAGAGKSDRFWR